MAFEDVGVIEFFECLYFPFEHPFFWLALNSSDIDDFDGYFFLRLIVGALINDRTKTSADDIFQPVRIILNFFA